jgi:KDO2-lipid IV(A) lauroyltransferase
LLRFLGRIFFHFMQLIGLFFRVLPFRLKVLIARWGALFWFYVIGFRRKTILLNLSHSFPREKEESSTEFRRRIYTLACKNLENYFLGFFEVLEKSTWSEEALRENLELTGLETMRNAFKDGRGVFILTAHMGNWELALALSNWVGAPMSVIVRHVRNAFWDEMLRLSRKIFDIHLLGENASGMTAMRAYKKGHMVVFVMDQHTGEPHGLLTKFFGMPAWSAKGLAILASRLQAPVLPVHTFRENGKVHVVVEETMDFSDLGECRDDEALKKHIQRCNDKIESWIRSHPEQYFWVHRRFKACIDYKNAELPF